MAKIKVENTEISVVNVQNEDYISLTDMAHSQMQEHIIFRWMSLKSTIEYLGEWEKLYNPFLIVPNSIQLEMQQEATTSCFLLRHGFKTDATRDKQIGNALCSLLPFSVIFPMHHT